MQVNSVNNVSFSARNSEKNMLKAEKKAIKQAQKDAHSAYISKMQANDSLKMSVGSTKTSNCAALTLVIENKVKIIVNIILIPNFFI